MAFHLIIPKSPSVTELQDIANKLQSSTAQVVVVFATEGQLLDLFLEVSPLNSNYCICIGQYVYDVFCRFKIIRVLGILK